MMPLKNKSILHVLPILLLSAFLVWHSLSIKHYPALQWWQRLASDFENTPLLTAVGIINDGRPITHFFYPAMTTFNIYGATLRAVSAISPEYRKVSQIKNISNYKELHTTLNKAAFITRLLVIISMIAFAGLMYALFYYLLSNKWYAFLWALFFISEKHILYYNTVQRMELHGFIFFVIMIIASLRFFQNTGNQIPPIKCVKNFILIGFLFGCCVFSKIQFAPALTLYLLIMWWHLFMMNNRTPKCLDPHDKNALAGLFSPFLCLIIFPWWAVQRPKHLTNEFLHMLTRWPFNELYGYPPGKESFTFIPLIALGTLAGLSVLYIALAKKHRFEHVLEKIFPILLFLDLFALGLILSIHIIPVGGSVSLSGYLVNTQSFLYATISGFYFKSMLVHETTEGLLPKLNLIYDFLNGVPAFFTTLFWLIVIALAWSGIRLLFFKNTRKLLYVYAMICIAMGFTFDFLATVRNTVIMYNYGIFSITFYISGIVLAFAGVSRLTKSLLWKRILLGVVSILFIAHFIFLFNKIIKEEVRYPEKLSLNYDWVFTRPYLEAQFFWDQVYRTLYETEEFQEIAQNGRSFQWGNDFKQIKRTVTEQDKSPQLVTADDKFGKVDRFIVDHTRDLKIKTYIYNYLIASADQLVKAGRFNDALLNYSKAISIFPSFPEAYQRRGRLYYTLKKYNESLLDMEAAKRSGGDVDPALLKQLKRMVKK